MSMSNEQIDKRLKEIELKLMVANNAEYKALVEERAELTKMKNAKSAFSSAF